MPMPTTVSTPDAATRPLMYVDAYVTTASASIAGTETADRKYAQPKIYPAKLSCEN